MSSGTRGGLAVVMPCLNDWGPVLRVVGDLSALASDIGVIAVYVVDDGSTEQPPRELLTREFPSLTTNIVRLQTNLGHQRALCIGLTTALKDESCSHFVLMDSDGEDRPSDIPQLLDALEKGGYEAAVATRRKRHSGNAFRALNRLFQWIFRVLTGTSLNFGNFMVLQRSTAVRLVNSADSWSNVPTSLMRSRVPIARCAIDRGPRHDGESRLGLVGLINHGLGAISVYSDVVFTRVIVASSAALAASILVGIAALVTRLVTGTPLPGWFALSATALAIGSLVLLVSVTLLTFTMLQSRRIVTAPLALTAEAYVASVQRLPIGGSTT